MASEAPRKFYLLTYPRTASNLLVQILALDDQPSLLSEGRREYFFAPTLRWKLGPSKLGGKHLNEWTQEERKSLMESFQTCSEALQAQTNIAAEQGKNIFVKEHVPWLVEPTAETKWVFGEESIDETPWTADIKDFPEQTRSLSNETIFSDEFLKTWSPTFLIRHPALVFPSNYRTCIDLEGVEAAKVEAYHAIEMSMHWSRALFDWYTRHAPSADGVWPIVLDADDIILEPDVVRKYSELLNLDSSRLKFSWDPVPNEQLEKMSMPEKRMKSTIAASAGIVKGKAAVNLDIAEEATKWKAEFGEEEGRKIENWVRAAMPDYEYMRGKRLRVGSTMS
jgi:hypothetical protein